MKNLFIIFVVSLSIFSCQENERLIFDGESNIYFKGISKGKDTITFTLVGKENGTSFDIPVLISGYPLKIDKKYRVEVVPEETTAKEGINYRLENEFRFPVDTFASSFPVILYKEDPDLATKMKFLTLRLVSTTDLGVAYDDRAKIVISLSTALRIPKGNGYSGDMTTFKSLFGVYSRKKHELIISLAGHDFWDGNYGDAGGLGPRGLFDEKAYYAPISRRLLQYINENEVYDENNNLILPW